MTDHIRIWSRVVKMTRTKVDGRLSILVGLYFHIINMRVQKVKEIDAMTAFALTNAEECALLCCERTENNCVTDIAAAGKRLSRKDQQRITYEYPIKICLSLNCNT